MILIVLLKEKGFWFPESIESFRADRRVLHLKGFRNNTLVLKPTKYVKNVVVS